MAKQQTPAAARRGVKIGAVVLAVVIVLVIVLNILMNVFRGYVDTYLGAGRYVVENTGEAADWETEYYTSDYGSKAESDAGADALVREIAAEGVVLLKNAGDALPLGDAPRVTLLGAAAADPIFGGTGSGQTAAELTDIRDGFTEAGFEINQTVYDLLAGYAEANPRGVIVMDNPAESSYNIGEMPVANYTDEAIASFADYNDAAVVVIGRPAGEGGDLTRDMSGWDDNYTPGQHQLELNADEQDLITLAKEHFDTVVVLINMSTTMELGLLEEDAGVDAILQVGSPGQSGFVSVGRVLTGEITPSGRTTDIFAADFTADPTFNNFGNYQYANISGLPASGSVDGNGYFVNYAEGIYVGYRYYETAAEEGFIDYDQAVVYPFGYGLSYTTFDWRVTGQTVPADTAGEIEVAVEVTNTGDVAGKEVVELYYSAPYTDGGIEKAHVVLGDFAKTSELAPGDSEVVTLGLPVEEMASYDYRNAGAYQLDAGDYTISLRTDSHTVKDGLAPITYTVAQAVTYSGDNHRASDAGEVTNQFDDVSAMFTDTGESGRIPNMSRADFAGTFPTAPTEDLYVASEETVAAFQPFDAAAAAAASDATMPTTGADNGLTLIDLRGKSYDDPMWDQLLDQLTVEEMSGVLLTGAYNTGAIHSIVKPITTDPDGPQGISSFLNPESIKGAAYTSEYMLAQTWNVELAERMGNSIGNEAYWLDQRMSGWYAPAMNMHRSPFAGRNFEYYSEDGLLAGRLAAAVTMGAQQKGVYTYIKHFAMNDQETNRCNSGVAVWANEQAIREIYLRPFEIAIKNVSTEVKYIADDQGTIATTQVGALAVMSSFNRIGATWSGGSEALQTNVLRNEWGFRGMVITDFNLFNYMSPDQGVANGSDLMLTIAPMKQFADSSSAWSVSNQRAAIKNILYATTNSAAMNGVAPGAEMAYQMATWEVVRIVVDVLLAGLFGWLIWRMVRKWRQAGQPAAVIVEGDDESQDKQ